TVLAALLLFCPPPLTTGGGIGNLTLQRELVGERAAKLDSKRKCQVWPKEMEVVVSEQCRETLFAKNINTAVSCTDYS
ncbi:hypothetical protein OV760_29410, partial [Salmonella enterica subsp. enterica serovar 1,4,[5],12:i:-]|nr:hypothetical protein [Salmonella enterica subsp. enterica serovar 1,4,[5],12:i:-]